MPTLTPDRTRTPLFGVVGGMGPMASAELVSTIYGIEPPGDERRAPRVLLCSDPAMPDRTEAIESGAERGLLDRLEASVRLLTAAGAERIVIACVTAHHVLDRLPPELASRCVSLVDLVFDELARATEPHLLLCTSGTARAGIFTRHPRWAEVADRVVAPAEADQLAVHRHIYRLKRGGGRAEAIEFVRDALARHGVRGFVAGCTEFHLVTKAIDHAGLAADLPSIDPMAIVAKRIKEGTL
jgi:aspartate racemase